MLCCELCKNDRTIVDAVWDWDLVGPRKRVLCWGAHWRHLLNTIAPFICSGNVAFCQIA